MGTMTLAMSNQPISIIVLTASFQWDFMANVPVFSRHHLHAAQMANAFMPHKDVSPHLGSNADPLHQCFIMFL
jgi:hypothetical protein